MEDFNIPPILRRSENGQILKKMKPGEFIAFKNPKDADNFRILAWRYDRKPVKRKISNKEIRIYVTK